MSRTDERTEPALPMTAEVGGEGGSYADPTVQVATFEGDLPRGEGHGGTSSTSNYAIRNEPIIAGAAGTEPDNASDMVRFATEAPPSSPTSSATPSARNRGRSGTGWRTGLAGAAAGAALALGLSKMRGRR